MFDHEEAKSWRLAEYINHSQEVFSRLSQDLDNAPIPNMERAIAAVGLYGDCLQFHRAILTLSGNELFSPAVSLGRLQLERLVKARWLLRHASDDQIKGFLGGKSIKYGHAMQDLKAEQNPDVITQWICSMSDMNWAGMNEATHAGAQYSSRFISNGVIQQRFLEKELMRLVTFSHSTFCIAGCEMLVLAEKKDSAVHFEKSLNSSFRAHVLRD